MQWHMRLSLADGVTDRNVSIGLRQQATILIRYRRELMLY